MAHHGLGEDTTHGSSLGSCSLSGHSLGHKLVPPAVGEPLPGCGELGRVGGSGRVAREEAGRLLPCPII